jgi:ABC-type glycerol-3-phosphate transport system substrate-binding protein
MSRLMFFTKILFPGIFATLFLSSCAAINGAVATEEQIPEIPSPEPSPTQPEPAQVPVTTVAPANLVEGEITIWLDWTYDEIAILTSMIDDFEAQFPGISISIVYLNEEDIRSEFKTAVEEGGGPSMIVGPSLWGKDFFESGLLQNIGSRIPLSLENSIIPVAWDQASVGNTFYALPFSMNGMVLYRNRFLVPQPPSSIQAWKQLARLSDGDNQVGVALDFGFPIVGAFFPACGGELLSADNKITLTQSAAECWIGLIQELSGLGPVTLNSDDDFTTFESGQAGWYIDSSERADHLAEMIGDAALAVDPWPGYEPTGNRLAGYTWVDNIYLSRNATGSEFDAAWLFALFMLSPEVQNQFAISESARRYPVLQTTTFEQPWLEEMIHALSTNQSFPEEFEIALFAEPVENEAIEVGLQGTAVDFALRRLFDNLDRNFSTLSADFDTE